MGKWDALVKGALLHDIGKVVYRANQGTDAHSKRGADFIDPYFFDKELNQSSVYLVVKLALNPYSIICVALMYLTTLIILKVIKRYVHQVINIRHYMMY